MRVLFFGTYDAERHPRVRVLREGLAAAGIEVLECNVPLDVGTEARVRALRQPWRASGVGVRLAAAWRQLRRKARALPPVDAVVVGYLGHFDVHLARRLWPDAPVVLDHLTAAGDTGRDRGAGPGVLRLLEEVDERALETADAVLVDTVDNLAALPTRHRSRALAVPVGASDRWFRAARASSPCPVRVVFFGLYTPLHGAPLIGSAISKLAGERLTFTMIGQGQELEVTRRRAGDNPHVTWIPWVPPEALPDVVGAHHVCLGIFGSTAKAQRVVPTKVFQGAASGSVVVTSDTSVQRTMLGEAGLHTAPGDPVALADVLATLARDPDRVTDLGERAHTHAWRSFRPERVTRPLVDLLSALAGSEDRPSGDLTTATAGV